MVPMGVDQIKGMTAFIEVIAQVAIVMGGQPLSMAIVCNRAIFFSIFCPPFWVYLLQKRDIPCMKLSRISNRQLP